MPHDMATQKAETLAAYAEMAAEGPLPDTADIDYFLVPTSDEADWRPLADALSREGYDCQYVEDDGAPYLVATLTDQALSAESLWIGEEVATRLALEHGFAPDGWGLEA
ncbi:ribonuclease E inhibitor RraB [Thetidibacter halocola]|uniref:Ribonuclease E inhibitor RraB n=1 Tax=Thetidibacter halocola TaxID=2827239 RepID=A0A8J7WGB2_9RHOB|nr:ribonuclease E inhibitor RraB [Thetidibacter halocola]MBS0125909.1 ribonuclease E inhibitor RraB [Thetidibacter halocola]